MMVNAPKPGSKWRRATDSNGMVEVTEVIQTIVGPTVCYKQIGDSKFTGQAPLYTWHFNFIQLDVKA